MKKNSIAFLGILIFYSFPSFAENKLPLTVGLFASTTCHKASNSAILHYWGKDQGIGDSHVHCHLEKLLQEKNYYTLFQKCTGPDWHGTGENTSFDHTMNITIADSKTFLMDQETYRYCGKRMEDFSDFFKSKPPPR